MRSITNANGHYTGTTEFLQKTSQWITSCMTVSYCARDLPRIAIVKRSTPYVLAGAYIIMDRAEYMRFDKGALSEDKDTESTMLLGSAGFMSHIDKVAICPPVKTELHASNYYNSVVMRIMEAYPYLFDCSDWDHYASEGRILRFTRRVRCAMQFSVNDMFNIFESLASIDIEDCDESTTIHFRNHRRIVKAPANLILSVFEEFPKWIGCKLKSRNDGSVALIDIGGQLYYEDDTISTTSMFSSLMPWIRVQMGVTRRMSRKHDRDVTNKMQKP